MSNNSIRHLDISYILGDVLVFIIGSIIGRTGPLKYLLRIREILKLPKLVPTGRIHQEIDPGRCLQFRVVGGAPKTAMAVSAPRYGALKLPRIASSTIELGTGLSEKS